MGSDFTILKKGLFLIAVPLLFQLAFIAFVAKMRWDNAEAQKSFVRSSDIIQQAAIPLDNMVEASSGIRAYILTDNPAYAEEYRDAARRMQAEFQTLSALVADHPAQARMVQAVREEADAFIAWLANLEQKVRNGQRDEAIALLDQQAGSKQMDRIRRQMMDFLAMEERIDESRHRDLDRTWRQLDMLLATATVLAVLSTVFLAVGFGKGIANRVGILTENARRLAEGEELTPPLNGGDELAQLDRAFRRMAETLNRAARKERAYRDLLEHRAEELAEVNRELEQKSQENEMFVYSVSHDLRSPLVNLQGFSRELTAVGDDLRTLIHRDDIPESLRKQGERMIDVEMGESIHFIQSAVSRLSGIIDALLRLSRAGRVEYSLQEVNVTATVQRIIDAMKGTIQERKAQIRVGELPTAWGDPTAVEQIFANLIGNALNYLDPDRPGQIEIGSISPESTDGDEPSADPMRTYYVRDNGLGIDESYLPKIFTAFQRLHKDRASGEGIGLALVRRMIERLEGKVWVESTVHVGSTFYVQLPSPVAEEPEPSPEIADPLLDELETVHSLNESRDQESSS